MAMSFLLLANVLPYRTILRYAFINNDFHGDEFFLFTMARILSVSVPCIIIIGNFRLTASVV